jgi:hypothetical protein
MMHKKKNWDQREKDKPIRIRLKNGADAHQRCFVYITVRKTRPEEKKRLYIHGVC